MDVGQGPTYGTGAITNRSAGQAVPAEGCRAEPHLQGHSADRQAEAFSNTGAISSVNAWAS